MSQVALVTGAARGIGAATVRGLAAAGWNVLAVDRCADDPALPYSLGTREELDRVVAEAAAAAAGAPDAAIAPGSAGSPPGAAAGRPGMGAGEPSATAGGLGTAAGGRDAAAGGRDAAAGGSGTAAGEPGVAAGGLGTVVAWEADVRDPAAMTGAVAAAERQWGGLDAAIAAAGVIAGGVPLWEMPEDQQRAVLDIDLGGVLALARAAVPALLRRPPPRSGRFLAVASAAATRGLPMLAAYCAAKAGVAGLIRALAVELRDSGITANAVSPGSTDTPMLAESARLYSLPGRDSFASQQPLGRLVSPDEVAAALVWLAGPGSSGMTGAVVPVDGGLAL
jgi:SDR family mycofactocin-dependent oxidoreductase